jgi:hypothetical protein
VDNFQPGGYSPNPEYQDLLDILGEVSMDGYCDRLYTNWEANVATPRLKELDFSNITWRMGECDSFGPLSRVCQAWHPEKGWVKLVYG